MDKYQEFIQKCRKGAAITNKKLTKEGRKKAALKGWRLRKKRLAAKQ
tara:strand:+ start:624 stop:764 length:141 start_codon:yes stop_codon:yes gene_type:complete